MSTEIKTHTPDHWSSDKRVYHTIDELTTEEVNATTTQLIQLKSSPSKPYTDKISSTVQTKEKTSSLTTSSVSRAQITDMTHTEIRPSEMLIISTQPETETGKKKLIIDKTDSFTTQKRIENFISTEKKSGEFCFLFNQNYTSRFQLPVFVFLVVIEHFQLAVFVYVFEKTYLDESV